MKIAYGRTNKNELGTIVPCETDWEGLKELFRTPIRDKITTAKYKSLKPDQARKFKNTGLFFGGRCKGGHRNGENVMSRTIINLDLDNDCDWLWDEYQLLGEFSALKGLGYIVHTTRSSTEEKPRFRILIPLAREVSPQEYEPVARAVAQMLDDTMLAVARESFTVAQGMYFPSVSADQEYHFSFVDGNSFDPDPSLKKYPADRPDLWPKRAKEICVTWKPGTRMAHPEEKKEAAPIITAVHRAIGPYGMLEDVLTDKYRQVGDRYAPTSATGAASVRVYDEAFIQSDHESDPARGQHNAFDVGRIHLFGHLDEGYDLLSMTPVEWPSYKAMTKAMLERDDVREVYDQIVAEAQAKRMAIMVDMLEEYEPGEDDDLIGESNTENTIEDVLDKARRVINNATTLNDLIARIGKVRALPIKDFSDTYRGLLAADIQRMFDTLGHNKPTKAEAKKMLQPTVADLREQVKQKAMPDWLKEWAYITSDSLFINLVTKERLPREGFNGRFNKFLAAEFGTTELGLSLLSAFDAATQVFEVPTPYETKYDPFKPELFEEKGVLYVNSHQKAIVPDGDYYGDEGVKLLNRWVQDVFPNEYDQNLFMDFMAHCIKFPGKKLQYAMLVKGAENEGKTLITNLIRTLVGKQNSAVIGTEALKEKFNGYGYEKVFVVVEEIKLSGSEAYDVLNKIKPTITNDEVPVRRMQKDVTTERNFANMLLTTNYEDSLPLDYDNSRFCVLFTRFKNNDMSRAWREELAKEDGGDYVARLYEHVRDRPGQFVKFFESYAFSKHYNPAGRAPMTTFKMVMAEDAKTEERLVLEEILEAGTDPTITDEILFWSSVKMLFDIRGIGTSIKGKGVASFLKPLGFLRANRYDIKIENRKIGLRIWTKNPSFVDEYGNLTQSGKIAVRDTYLKAEKIEDGFENVVQLRI